jgi:hypothetical protein
MTATAHAVVSGPASPGPETRTGRLQALRARMLADGWQVLTDPSDADVIDLTIDERGDYDHEER